MGPSHPEQTRLFNLLDRPDNPGGIVQSITRGSRATVKRQTPAATQVQLLTLLSLFKLSWRHEKKGEEFPQFDLLAEEVNSFLGNEPALEYLLQLSRSEEPAFQGYVLRVLRSLAAQCTDEATGTRQFLFGCSLFVSQSAEVQVAALEKAGQMLAEGLEYQWRELGGKVKLQPLPYPLEELANSSMRHIRSTVRSIQSDSPSPQASLERESVSLRPEAWVFRGVVSVPADFAAHFSKQFLLPSGPSAEQMRLKHRVESVLEDAELVRPVVGPPCEWGNLFSMVRINHFKMRAYELVKNSQDDSAWAISLTPQKVRMINFKVQHFEDFSFPDESQEELREILRPFVDRLGISMHNLDE